MRSFCCALLAALLVCGLTGCGEEEGSKAGQTPAATPPPDLQKLFQRPDNKKSPSRKKAQVFPAPPGLRSVAEANHLMA